jgi:hypothetical protein
MEFKTRFNLYDVVYIRDPSRRNPEPVVISDIRIHCSTTTVVIYSITYRGTTDARQKDFKEEELVTLSENLELYYKNHPEELDAKPEGPITYKIRDVPVPKISTKEDQDAHSDYPPRS